MRLPTLCRMFHRVPLRTWLRLDSFQRHIVQSLVKNYVPDFYIADVCRPPSYIYSIFSQGHLYYTSGTEPYRLVGWGSTVTNPEVNVFANPKTFKFNSAIAFGFSPSFPILQKKACDTPRLHVELVMWRLYLQIHSR